MYDIALTVGACLRADTRVDVAWLVATESPEAEADPTQALALTPGGGRAGGIWNGALDPQLADQASVLTRGRLVTVEVGRFEAEVAGLRSGGRARCVLVPAGQLPAELWDLLDRRRPVCLVTRLDGDEVRDSFLVEETDLAVAGPEVETLWRRGTSAALVREDRVITVLRPVPTLVVAGPGPVAGALADLAPCLGWRVHRAVEPERAAGLCLGLTPLDSVVVTGHDDEAAVTVLFAALSGRGGYLAAVSAADRHRARATQLSERGASGIERVHSPAGLDIGAATPAEVAVAILAEAIAVRARDRQGIA